MKGIGIIAAAAALVMLAGCSAGDGSAEEVRRRGTLRIAVAESEQLYELSEHIAQCIGAEPQLIPTEEETALRMLYDGSADAAVGYFSERNNPGISYAMTLPFYRENICAVVRAEDFITASADLNDKLIGADDTLPESVSRAGLLLSSNEQLYCTDVNSAAEMLQSGTLDAFLCLESRAYQLIGNGDTLRCYPLPDIQPERYCAVVLRSNQQLYGEVNGAVGEYLTGGKQNGIL